MHDHMHNHVQKNAHARMSDPHGDHNQMKVMTKLHCAADADAADAAGASGLAWQCGLCSRHAAR